MSGVGGGKGLVGYIFLYAKDAKCLVMPLCLGPGGLGDQGTLDLLLVHFCSSLTSFWLVGEYFCSNRPGTKAGY